MKKIFLAAAAALFSHFLVFSQVLMAELAPTNTGQIEDADGDRPDWIELVNAGSSPANLGGYSLSDKKTPYQWAFPSLELQPGERLLVFASGKNRGAGTAQPNAIDHWETAIYENDNWQFTIGDNPLPTDWATPDFEDSVWQTAPGGLGYGDNDDATEVPAGTLSIFLRKKIFITDTSQIVATILSADYDDGFAAYLNGVEIARSPNLPNNADWDTPATPDHEALMYNGGAPEQLFFGKNALAPLLRPGPNVLAIEIHNVEPGSSDLTARFWLHFAIASGQSFFGQNPNWFDPGGGNPGGSQELHTNFKINFKENITLYNPVGNIVDSMGTGELAPGHTRTRANDTGDWCITDAPTPDAPNSNTCYANYAPSPMPNVPAGFYNGTQIIDIQANGTGEIRYSLDGSEPDANSPVLTTSLEIDKTTVLRLRRFEPGKLPSHVATATYFIDEPTTLPVISVSLPPDDFDDVYTNYWRKGRVGVEFFDKNRQRQMAANAAGWVVGNWSVGFPQKSLQFEASEEFGSTQEFDYPLFMPDKNISKFKSFRIRNEDDDWTRARMRDRIVNELAAPTHAAWAAFHNVTGFINGEYWGHFNMRERLDPYFVRDNYGADPDSVTIVKTHFGQNTYQAEAGNLQDFYDLSDFIASNDMGDPGNFAHAADLLDLDNFTDYFATEIFVANTDWLQDYFNNIRLFKASKPKIKWKFLLWDCSYSSGNGTGCNNCDVLGSTLANPFGSRYGEMFNKLLENQNYRRYFVNRFADLLNTHFRPEKAHALIERSAAELAPEIQRHHERWGTGDLQTWQYEVQVLKDFYSERPAHQRQHIVDNFGLEKTVSVTLRTNPPGAGHIQISTLTLDSLPWTGIYFKGNPVTVRAVAAPGYTFENWTTNQFIADPANPEFTADIANNTTFRANFSGAPAANGLVVSEINYNSDSTRNAGDWLEIHNVGATTLDISGYKIRDIGGTGEFSVPNGTNLPAGGYLVFYENKNRFESQFPTVLNKLGPLPFGFRSSGDTVIIANALGAPVANAACDRENPWPCTPNGFGRTLERRDFLTDPLTPEAWFEGCVGGSPGGPFAACDETPTISEINYRSSPDFDPGDWFEIHNRSASPVAVGGWTVRDDDDAHLYVLPAGTQIPANGYLVLAEDVAKFSARFPSVANRVGPLGFAFSGNGDVIRLYNAAGKLHISVCFDDAAPWDEQADGMGYTLENMDFAGNINAASAWESGCYGGSPGVAFDPDCPPLGSGEAWQRANVQVFPNPAHDRLLVKIEEVHGEAELRLRDVFGKIVLEKTSTQAETLLETGHLASGVYWLEVSVPGKFKRTVKVALCR